MRRRRDRRKWCPNDASFPAWPASVNPREGFPPVSGLPGAVQAFPARFRAPRGTRDPSHADAPRKWHLTPGRIGAARGLCVDIHRSQVRGYLEVTLGAPEGCM
jgi:hypothetical protein